MEFVELSHLYMNVAIHCWLNMPIQRRPNTYMHHVCVYVYITLSHSDFLQDVIDSRIDWNKFSFFLEHQNLFLPAGRHLPHIYIYGIHTQNSPYWRCLVQNNFLYEINVIHTNIQTFIHNPWVHIAFIPKLIEKLTYQRLGNRNRKIWSGSGHFECGNFRKAYDWSIFGTPESKYGWIFTMLITFLGWINETYFLVDRQRTIHSSIHHRIIRHNYIASCE